MPNKAKKSFEHITSITFLCPFILNIAHIILIKKLFNLNELSVQS